MTLLPLTLGFFFFHNFLCSLSFVSPRPLLHSSLSRTPPLPCWFAQREAWVHVCSESREWNQDISNPPLLPCSLTCALFLQLPLARPPWVALVGLE